MHEREEEGMSLYVANLVVIAYKCACALMHVVHNPGQPVHININNWCMQSKGSSYLDQFQAHHVQLRLS